MPDPEHAPLIARAFEELATGRFTKQEVIARMTEAGLRTRRGLVLSPQSFGQMVRNSIYVGRVESPDYGVSILHVWEQPRAEANDRTAEQQRRVSAIQQKVDKLDEAFLYSEAIDVTTYGRPRDKLREELTLAKIDHHAEAVDELDVEGILAFAERILPRASDLWVQASLDQKQRLQQLFFPEGIAFDGNRFNRTAATAPLFKYLAPSESADEKMVSLNFASWNQLERWLNGVDLLRRAA